jgi:hypothetical protein
VASCSLTLACSEEGDDSEGPTDAFPVTATVSERIATVVTVTWSTPEPSRGYVEYGLTSDLGFTTPLSEEATLEHSQLLLGLTDDTEYFYRVVAGEESGAKTSEIKKIRTGYFPPGMPDPEVVGEGQGDFIVTSVLGANNGAYIFNSAGRVVWYWKDDDRDLQSLRAHLARDKRSILYNATRASGEPVANSEIVRVSLDGSETSSVVVPYLAHDFLELPDGTMAAVVVETVDVDGMQVKSNAIVEVAPDGTTTQVWSALDCFDPAVNMSSEPDSGWTLANALDYDEVDDVYYFGTRGLSSIARVNRQTYECDWVIGEAGTLAFADGSATFLHQHQFELQGDRLLVYDNDGATEDASRVLEYQVDFTAETVTEVWSFIATPTVYTPVLGEPMRLANGDVLIDWSYAGQIQQVTPDGETVWQLNTKAGYPLGYIRLEPTLYRGSPVR